MTGFEIQTKRTLQYGIVQNFKSTPLSCIESAACIVKKKFYICNSYFVIEYNILKIIIIPCKWQ